MVGGLGGVDFPQIGFKPNLVIICGDPQGSNAIQELVNGGELYRIQLFSRCRTHVEIISDDPRGHRWRQGRRGGHEKSTQPEGLADSQSSFGDGAVFKDGKGILPDRDGTEELSMKAPMSVSKPADLG